MPQPDLSLLLPHIISIAQEAGKVILPYWQNAPRVTNKADGSPVSAADEAADLLITKALRALPHSLIAPLPIISEEGVAQGEGPPTLTADCWLVDPLDGTREFLSGSAEYTVNIALIRDYTPVLGVIYAPATGHLYAGMCSSSQPGQAWYADNTRRHPLQVSPPLDLAHPRLRVAASRSHGRGAELEHFLARLPIEERLYIGSSLKFCLIAAGKADLYVRFGHTYAWDTAAGEAILKAAGGIIQPMGLLPFAYGRPPYLNPPFTAWNSQALANWALSKVAF
jgi:3'(2'), 5'-bisphosphate nucleotidase